MCGQGHIQQQVRLPWRLWIHQTSEPGFYPRPQLLETLMKYRSQESWNGMVAGRGKSLLTNALGDLGRNTRVGTSLNLVSFRPQPNSLGVLGSLDPQIFPGVCWGEGPLPASSSRTWPSQHRTGRKPRASASGRVCEGGRS